MCEKQLFENVKVCDALDCLKPLQKKLARKVLEWKVCLRAENGRWVGRNDRCRVGAPVEG